MIWFFSFFALCIMVGVLDNAPIRKMIVLVFALGFGIQYGWEERSFMVAYEWFIGMICVVGMILSPFLWVCFGIGAYAGNGGFSRDD